MMRPIDDTRPTSRTARFQVLILSTTCYRKEYDGKIEDISCGIMAQDVQKYAPEAFWENPDGVYTYKVFELVPYLIKAIQELNQKLEAING